jgi:hypothetical protein
MSWRYYLKDADNSLVNSEGGFSTELQAIAAANEYRKKLISSPDYRVSRNYIITTGQDRDTAN